MADDGICGTPDCTRGSFHRVPEDCWVDDKARADRAEQKAARLLEEHEKASQIIQGWEANCERAEAALTAARRMLDAYKADMHTLERKYERDVYFRTPDGDAGITWRDVAEEAQDAAVTIEEATESLNEKLAAEVAAHAETKARLAGRELEWTQIHTSCLTVALAKETTRADLNRIMSTENLKLWQAKLWQAAEDRAACAEVEHDGIRVALDEVGIAPDSSRVGRIYTTLDRLDTTERALGEWREEAITRQKELNATRESHEMCHALGVEARAECDTLRTLAEAAAGALEDIAERASRYGRWALEIKGTAEEALARLHAAGLGSGK